MQKSKYVFFVLASSSKSRLNLLDKIGYRPNLVISPQIDEKWHRGEKPKDLSVRLSKQKCFASLELLKSRDDFDNILKTHSKIVLLSADTVCGSGARVLDKALNDEDVRACMKALSGKNHSVYTSMSFLEINTKDFDKSFTQDIKKLNTNIAAYKFYNVKKNLPNFLQFKQITTSTRIKFKKLSNEDIERFVKSGQGLNNAGGYTIGGIAESFCININGSYSSVIGLSTYHVDIILERLGFERL